MKMEKNSKQGPDVLKLVHPGGLVEMYEKPVTAADVMKKNPRHCVTRPDVFKFPWIVVRPDAVLKPGNIFFVVPNHTLTRLLKQHKLDSFQEEELAAAASASTRACANPVPEEGLPLRTRERKAGPFGLWGDHQRESKGGIKARFGFGKKGSNRSSTSSPRAGRRSQDEKRAGGFQLWGDHHLEEGIKLDRFSFGKRSSGSSQDNGEASKETAPDHLHQFLRRQRCETATGRAKVDCKFEEEGQEESIFPKCLVGCRNNNSNQYFDKASFPKSSKPCIYDTPRRRPFNGDRDWMKGYGYDDEMNHNNSYFTSQGLGFGYESNASTEGLYNDQRPWLSLSIPPGGAAFGCQFPSDDGMKLDIRDTAEVNRITLKSCLKKDNLRRDIRVKFCRPGEDERKLRVEVFEFES